MTAARGVERDPVGAYRTACERHQETLERVRGEVRRVETGRVVTFLIASVVGLLYQDLPIGPTWSLVIAGISATAFAVLLVRHRRLRGSARRTEIAASLARLGTLRLRREWRDIFEEHGRLGYVDPLLDPNAERADAHPYSEDLDLFGEASLRALFGPTPTPTGVATLGAWLRAPAPVGDIMRRQRAVQALTSDFQGREALATEALLVEGVTQRAWALFVEWLSEPPLFMKRGSKPGPAGVGTRREAAREVEGVLSPPTPTLPTWSILVARCLPPVTLTLFVLDVGVGLNVPPWAWIAPLLIQGFLARRWGPALHGYLDRASGRAPGLRRYHGLLNAWEEYHATDDSVAELQRRLNGGDGVAASSEIRRLGRWLDAADSRSSMGHLIFGVVFLWDVHVAWGLERWRRGAGTRVEDWFEALGELEALAAMATLAHDHPEWCWPEFRSGEPGFEAEALGHPLLAESVLRTSDVRVEAPGRFLLVTGSNMSGKSTLLRSIGLAAVMGQAGSVVCARHLTMTPLRTFTSMRIQDSLTGGVSLFMAELNRLKQLVDAADRQSADGPALLYLIDEVLQGTNSEERRIAARRIVSHLFGTRAIGAVTTHDLSLHEDGRLDRAATKVHFREHVGGGDGAAVLTFDYKLRPGLATSRNALKLLEIVGLGDEDPSGL